ncbi:MAG: chorismate mutase [Bacteroidia bacterium]
MKAKLEISPLNQWLKGEKPYLIAGPCSIESEEQITKTAVQLKDKGVSLIRAGAWKPRSRPGNFEGHGKIALQWLVEAGRLAGLPVATEVANAKHAVQVIESGVDVVWLGARTTVNPFLVQEIADAIAGNDIPVLIKNPINPDLQLWLGSIERIAKAGITKIVAVHRGFSSFENTHYRNKPNWEIPIELKRQLPQIPLICDPSHICGTTDKLQIVSQTALDLNFDGLMIETHHNPSKALSDANQQITPDQLSVLLQNLVLRKPEVGDVLMQNLLEELRDQIDNIDMDLLDVLSKRMEIARLIGKYKKENFITILQPERWAEIVRTRTYNGQIKDLTAEFVHKIFEFIHQESIHHQTMVMNTENETLKEKN